MQTSVQPDHLKFGCAAVKHTNQRGLGVIGPPRVREVFDVVDRVLGLPFDRHRLVFAHVPGAGVIGLELGSVWSRLGSEVEIFEAEKTFLPMLDDDISRLIEREFKNQNISINLGAMVKSSKNNRSSVTLEIDFAGQVEKRKFDKVIVAVGRKPFSENLLAKG